MRREILRIANRANLEPIRTLPFGFLSKFFRVAEDALFPMPKGKHPQLIVLYSNRTTSQLHLSFTTVNSQLHPSCLTLFGG